MVDLEETIATLRVQQNTMSEDVREMKTALRDIAASLKTLSVLEEKHANSDAAIKRGHSRIDDHEKRIRELEFKIAGSLWIERVIWVVVAGVLGVWIKGGF